MKYQSLRGTKDILPDETPVWQLVESTFHDICQKAGFKEIRTPVIESSDLFKRAVGDNTDIVSKEMYEFPDKKGRMICLRPEGTAAVVRACIENSLFVQGKETRLYYTGPMFRYERPQAGRQRQFHQLGIECFGSSKWLDDYQVIGIALEFLSKLGIKDIGVKLNSVGCSKCRPDYVKELKGYLEKHSGRLCEDCRVRTEKNPLRVFDCKNAPCKEALQEAPRLSLCEKCGSDLEGIKKLLSASGYEPILDADLVRGLDYYTGTVFEIFSGKLGAQDAVCGGGRYDDLVKSFEGGSVPAVGMAIGFERLVSLIPEEVRDKLKRKTVYYASLDEMSNKISMDSCSVLRNDIGISQNVAYLGGMFSDAKAGLKHADKIGADHAVLVSDNGRNIKIRDMKSGHEVAVADVEQLNQKLKEILK